MIAPPKKFLRFVTDRPKCEIVTLDQPLVDWLLSINTSNRKVKPSVVHTYANAIRRGEWDVTSQGIGVSSEGVLIDGQHRLLALRECGYPPTESVLVCGLKKDAQLKVDIHAKRSAANLLTLALGITADNTRAAALRILVLIRRGDRNLTSPVPVFDLAECYEETRTVWDTLTFSHKGANGLNGGFTAACVFAAMCGVKSEIVQRFVDGYASGADLPKGSPILRLRAAYAKGSTSGSRGQITWFSKTARMLAAFANGDTPDKLYTPEAKDAIALLQKAGASSATLF